MQLVKRVIQAARERALVKFVALTRLMVKDADNAIAESLLDIRSGVDKKIANGALQFLRYESAPMLSRMEVLFRESMDRATRTMYNDLRQGLTNFSADKLTLIDDEAVTKQLEVGNLVQRLRDACNENLGRLNIMIAQIHGDPDVHERENPFRPYLFARALYDALRERVNDQEVSKLLFDRLADSLASNLSNFYGSLCEVFDASGIQARLMARPTKLKRHQRDQLAEQLSQFNRGGGAQYGGLPFDPMAELSPRVAPSLQRMQERLQRASGGDADAGMDASARSASNEELQDYIWKMFNQSRTSPDSWSAASDQDDDLDLGGSSFAGAADEPAPASAALLSQLEQFQQRAASGQSLDQEMSPDDNQLFVLGDKLEAVEARPAERMAIDVIAILFEFILEDEQIPADLRLQIGRLQIPLLKAAMLSPELLQNTGHPARLLLNRMGTAAVGIDTSTDIGKSLAGEIGRLVKKVLQNFDKDVAVFNECLQELEGFLAKELRNTDAETARSVDAVEEAEKASIICAKTAASLREIMDPLPADWRAVDFIMHIWIRVLVRASQQDAAGDTFAGIQIAEQYRDVLPELIWSAMEKPNPADRSALMRVLPGLVKRLKIGMLMIHLTEEECQQALDSLVSMHTQVLRPNQEASGKTIPALDELRQQFARLVISEDATWTLEQPPEVAEEMVETMLADKGGEADVAIEPADGSSGESDAAWLSMIQLGTCVQVWAADTHVMARVIWVSRHHSLFIFKIEAAAKPLVYSAASLVKAMREATIRLVEYAPAFDRAVDSLMAGAEQVARQ